MIVWAPYRLERAAMKDLLSLPPTPGLPLSLNPLTVVAGDLDADGRWEVVALSPSKPALGVLSWLDLAEIEPGWSGATPQLVAASIAVGTTAGGWQLRADDQL